MTQEKKINYFWPKNLILKILVFLKVNFIIKFFILKLQFENLISSYSFTLWTILKK